MYWTSSSLEKNMQQLLTSANDIKKALKDVKSMAEKVKEGTEPAKQMIFNQDIEANGAKMSKIPSQKLENWQFVVGWLVDTLDVVAVDT